jgi:hypothetical protein
LEVFSRMSFAASVSAWASVANSFSVVWPPLPIFP